MIKLHQFLAMEIWFKDYYVEGLNHNLFSVGQFCDADLEVAWMDLEVAFRKTRKSARNRCEMCMFRTAPWSKPNHKKTSKKPLADSALDESMQEELHHLIE
ncbi:hypothetical protein Tco_0619544 [Tanacetum coccineum]